MEFTEGCKPCVADFDWPLAVCAEITCRPLASLVERPGPTINSTTIFDKVTEQPIAVYRPLKSLLPLLTR